MKILVVAPSYYKSRGGMATVVDDIRTDKILNEKYDIDLYSSYIDGNLAVRLLYSAFSIARFFFIGRGYDLYHIHAASYGSTSRKRIYGKLIKHWGKPFILHIHGAEYMKYYDALPDQKKRKVRDFLHSADSVIALSDFWKDTFIKTFDLTNCVSVPNGINPATYQPAVSNPEETKNAFLFLGRVGERKGAWDLIEAFGRAAGEYPNLHLYMAGDGEVDKARKLVEDEGLTKNISVVGWIDNAGKLEYLKKCGTLVLPSYNEGLPMAILESMAAEKAILSTTVGAIPEVIKEENGILITAGDVNALHDALEKLYTTDGLIASMGRCNIQKITECYSTSIMHKQIADVYDLYQS